MNTQKQMSTRVGGCFYFRSLVAERKEKEVIETNTDFINELTK
jgi:hypothetical protein